MIAVVALLDQDPPVSFHVRPLAACSSIDMRQSRLINRNL